MESIPPTHGSSAAASSAVDNIADVEQEDEEMSPTLETPPHLVLLFQADDSCPPGDPRARPCSAYVE